MRRDAAETRVRGVGESRQTLAEQASRRLALLSFRLAPLYQIFLYVVLKNILIYLHGYQSCIIVLRQSGGASMGCGAFGAAAFH